MLVKGKFPQHEKKCKKYPCGKKGLSWIKDFFCKFAVFKIIGQLIEVCLLLIARQPVFEMVLTTSFNCPALPYDKIPF